jgi:hypothetical protein
MASGVGYDPERWRPGVEQAFRELRRVVTNLAVLDFGGPQHAMRLRSVHPGVTAQQVREQTGFALVVAEAYARGAGPAAFDAIVSRLALPGESIRRLTERLKEGANPLPRPVRRVPRESISGFGSESVDRR